MKQVNSHRRLQIVFFLPLFIFLLTLTPNPNPEYFLYYRKKIKSNISPKKRMAFKILLKMTLQIQNKFGTNTAKIQTKQDKNMAVAPLQLRTEKTHKT